MLLPILKSLADPVRLRLVAILTHGEFTVQELTEILQMGQSRISRHLKILTDASVLQVNRQGTWAYYRLVSDNWFRDELFSVMQDEINRVDEADADRQQIALILQKRREKSRSFFDTYARDWDRLAQQVIPLPRYYQQIFDQLKPESSVLEIGTGTGVLLGGLSEDGRAVIGVDNSPAMLEEAQGRLDAAGIKSVDLRLGDMEHLPLKDNEVDSAVLNMVLHHAADPQTVLQEVARVVESDGRLILADLVEHQQEQARTELADQWLGFKQEEVEGWLQGVGFKPTSWQIIEEEGRNLVFVATATK